jgi:transposase
MRIISYKRSKEVRRKKFTDQETEILLKNENILSVSDTNIKYCPEFKLKAIKEYNDGKFPMQIFMDAGINIEIIGSENPGRCVDRWRRTYKTQGEKGILEEQRGKTGRPRIRELSIEEKLKKAEARITYLEAENDFLKKLKALERGLI